MTVPGCLIYLVLAAPELESPPAPAPVPPTTPTTSLDAPIVEVTVFADRARVTRALRLPRWPATRFLLPRLPAGADADSVRVEVRGEGARLDWIDVHRASPDEVAPAATTAVLNGLAQVQRDLARVQAGSEFLRHLAIPAEDAEDAENPEDAEFPEQPPAATRLQPAAWARAVAVLDRERARLLSGAREQDQVSARLERTKQELEARGRALLKNEGLVVSARLSAPGPAELRLTYDVKGARWEPAYDVHLDPRSDRVTVSLWAAVQQATGEDWPAVDLTVSSAAPVTPVLPELPAWRIGERELFVPTTQMQATPPPSRAPVAAAQTSTSSELRQALEGKLEQRSGQATAQQSFDLEMVENIPTQRPDAPGHGRITGYVFDQSGLPLTGVAIELDGGRRTYSREQGTFALDSVPAGTHQIRAWAPKLKPVIQSGVAVKEGQNTELNLIIEVAGGEVEELKVMQREPLVATTRGNVQESFDAGAGPSLPSSAPETRQPVALAPPPLSRPAAGNEPMRAAGGHTLVFHAPAPETVTSDASSRRVPLHRYQVTATTERHFYPAVASGAFVLAELRNPAAAPLPAGPASLAVGADPAGQANLGLTLPRQSIRLPLGLDQSLRAVRRMTQRSHHRGLIRREEVTRYDVVTEISNPNPWPLRAVVHDQLPISSDRSVDITLVESSIPPRRRPETGALSFPLVVPPGATRSVRFAYTLSRPRGHRLHQ